MIFWTMRKDGLVCTTAEDSPRTTAVFLLNHNILTAPWPPPALVAAPRIVVWSGWIDGEHAAMQTWSPDAWNRLLVWCANAGRWARENGVTLSLRPHARHIISDAPRCVAITRELAELPIDIVLDPAAMLTPEMLPLAGEHIARIIMSLGGHARIAGIVVANVSDDGLVPLDHGRIDSRVIASAVREHWPWEKPIILLGEDVAGQRAIIEG